jgi:cytochrome c oxidase assembly protein subunit 15
MNFSSKFIVFNWITLVSIYLVVIAGSFVRISGSGMGCPDWPKCFGQWIPPTDSTVLPKDYKEIYLEKREKKVEKFSGFLEKLGFDDKASQLRNDPDVYTEESFNARKTWTEYINRLLGFLAGNFMLLAFLWMFIAYRNSGLLLITLGNLVLMGIEAWFGSIVVATNLVPWTITVHMLLALIIIAVQTYVLFRISPMLQRKILVPQWVKTSVWIIFLITFYQMFLGTQVREDIDALVKSGYSREEWVDSLGLPFLIHRSFSWLVLVGLVFMAWKNELSDKIKLIRGAFLILVIELVSGVLLAYADMPGLVQTAHLVFATLLFGLLWIAILRFKSNAITT